MKHFFRFGFLALTAIAGWQCGGQGGSTGDQATAMRPEEVVRRYQEYVDKNRFEEAKQLSTPREQANLNALADVVAGEIQDSTILHTEFLNINCEIEDDTARCLCLVQDQYERYRTLFTLVRANGRWLIDAPENNGQGPREEEMVDDLLDSVFLN